MDEIGYGYAPDEESYCVRLDCDTPESTGRVLDVERLRLIDDPARPY